MTSNRRSTRSPKVKRFVVLFFGLCASLQPPAAAAEEVGASVGVVLKVKPMSGPTKLQLGAGDKLLRSTKVDGTRGGTLEVAVSGSAGVPSLAVETCTGEGIHTGAFVSLIGTSPGTIVSASFTPIGRDATDALEQKVTQEVVAETRQVTVRLCVEVDDTGSG